MYGEIMQAVKDMALTYAMPYTAIENGAIPPKNGIAIAIGPSNPDERHFNRGGRYKINLILNAKHQNLETVSTVLSKIHIKLSQAKQYPKTQDWQIYSIESNPGPNFIEQESSTKQWLFGSVLEVSFYVKGV